MTQLFTCSFRMFRPEMGLPVITSHGLPMYIDGVETWQRLWVLTPTATEYLMEGEEFSAHYLAWLER